MKALLITLYVILLGGSATVSGFAQQTNVSATQQSPRYFIHVFSSAIGIESGTDMDLSDTNFQLQLYRLELTTNILLGERFEKPSDGGGGPTFWGYVEAHDGKYFLHTSCFSYNTTDYTGEIVPEIPFSPALHPMPNAAHWGALFVLSTHSDYKPFQEKLIARTRSAISKAQK